MDGIEGDCVCGSGCLFLLPEILQLAHPIAITSSTAALYQPHLFPQSPPDDSVASTGNHPPRQPTRSICHMPTCSLPTSILIFPLFRQPAIRSSPFPLPLLRLPPSLPSFTAWDWTFALKLQKNLTPECCILGPPQFLNIKEQYGAWTQQPQTPSIKKSPAMTWILPRYHEWTKVSYIRVTVNTIFI